MRIKTKAILIFVNSVNGGYPACCTGVEDSDLQTVKDCDVICDPLPFRWTSIIKIKKHEAGRTLW